MAKHLFVKTYGCQMNVYDSQKIVDVLKPWGYAVTEEADQADVILINTCNVREKAEEKLYSDLGRYAHIKAQRLEKGSNTAIVVAGCVAQAHGVEIVRRMPCVDMVVGPQTLHRIPEMIARIERMYGSGSFKSLIDTEFPMESKFDTLPVESSFQRVSAFLTIQEGCDKFCTFCCVPYTRGVEFSRPVSAILQEAQVLVDQGTKEITLLGQNVNAYHGLNAQGQDTSLGVLIELLARIPGLQRIRYMTSHPCDVDDTLIAAHRDIPQLMPFLHLPVQSGSDRVLKKMNRKHTAQTYKEVIDRFRTACPKIAFSSDFIVGFPEETEEDFQATLDLVNHVGFAQSFSFKYSPRPGTPASLMEQVPDTIQSERLQRLQECLLHHQTSFNQSFVGQTIPVLFEKKGRHDHQLMGKTPHGQSVFVEADDSYLTHICDVTLESAYAQSLTGTIAS